MKMLVRSISCPVCCRIFDWIEDRQPIFCPECGQSIIHELRANRQVIATREVEELPPQNPLSS